MLSKFERRPVDSVDAVRRTCNVVVDGATFEERGGRFEWVSNAVELEVRHYSAVFLRRLLAWTPHVTSLVLRDVDAAPCEDQRCSDASAASPQDTDRLTRCRLQSLTVHQRPFKASSTDTEKKHSENEDDERQAIEDAAIAVLDCCDCEYLEAASFNELPEAILYAFLWCVQSSSKLQDLDVRTVYDQRSAASTSKQIGDIGRCLLRCQSHVEKGSFVSLRRLWLVRPESLRLSLVEQQQRRLVEPGDDAEVFTEALAGCKGVIDLNLSGYDFRPISIQFVKAIVESGIAERCWLVGTNPQPSSLLVSFKKRDEDQKALFGVDHWTEMVTATVVAGGATANDPSTNEILSRMRKRLDDEQRPAPASPPSAAATGRTVTSSRAPTVKVMMFSYPYEKKVEILEPLAEPNATRPFTFPLRYTVSDVGNMSVWDINSQQRYESLRGIYCRGSTAALVVFPLVVGAASSSTPLEDQKEGFSTALRWKREYLDNVSVVKDDKNAQLRDAKDALVFLLVNSEDLAKVMPSSVRGPLKTQIEQFHKSNGFHGLFYVSPTAESGNSVKRAFEEMLVTILTTCGVRTQREIKGNKEKVPSLFFGAEEEEGTWVSNVYGGWQKRR